METILVIGLALFAAFALLVWWMRGIDIADIVAIICAPIAGLTLIYSYHTPLAWAGGAILLLIGAFALIYLINHRARLRK
jgi:hypothetical protein